jgi:hypothetical protein
MKNAKEQDAGVANDGESEPQGDDKAPTPGGSRKSATTR